MNHNRLIMQSLPMVASVLGKKYGVKVKIGGNAAYTDGKTIQLPAFPLDGDQTLVGLARGYIDHESAHVRETRFDWLTLANLTPLEKHIWNTFEDWRVEHKLTEVFPGCRQNFNWLISHLFGNETEQATDPANSILNWLLLSVRAWDVPALDKERDQLGALVQGHFPGLVDKICRVLQKVQSRCESTQDCILYAREVVSILKNAAEQEMVPRLPRMEGSESVEQEENPPPGRVPLEAQSLPGDTQRLKRLLNADATALPKGMGEILAEELVNETPKSPDQGLQVATVGKKTVEEFPPLVLLETRKSSTALRVRLQSLLQATVLKRSCIGRQGRLDPHQLSNLAVADGRVFRRNGVKQGINTAVHILLDCSGSMRKQITLATQACHAVAAALESIQGITVGVTVFPAGAPVEDDAINNGPTVYPLVAQDERVHSRFAIRSSGGTPLGEALWWVLQKMQPLTESRKIILILTDGDPDHRPNALEAIEAGQRVGFEIYGLGIDADAITKLLPNHSRVIHELPELAPAMFTLLQSALLSR